MSLVDNVAEISISKCPQCGSKLVKDKKDYTYTYKGESLVLKQLPGLYCTQCDEAIYDVEIKQLIIDAANILNKKVNSTEVTPEFIAQARKQLNLTQGQADTVFGAGVNMFSRYESGKAIPPIAIVKLLRLLKKHPELLAELNAD